MVANNKSLRSASLLNPDNSEQTVFRIGPADLAANSGGGREFARQGPGPQTSIDNVPGDTNTTAALTVGAPATVSAIDIIADQDFYQITLVAGHEYQIGMFGYTPSGAGDPLGPNGSPLLDFFLELYDAAGHLITSADGGADTTLNEVNSGLRHAARPSRRLDRHLLCQRPRLRQRAARRLPTATWSATTSSSRKDVTNDPSVYHPYYAPTARSTRSTGAPSVNKVNQSAANPDGNEGIAATTGNAQGTPVYTRPST